MLSFKPVFPLSSFILIKRLFCSSLLSAISAVSSANIKKQTNKQRSWHLVPSLHGKYMGKNETVTNFIFLGSKITEDSDCSHKIKRTLLLRTKTMTNLDSMLKSRHITLLTKFHIVTYMVFPVVTDRCQSWTIKKVEC